MNFRNISSWCIRNPVGPIVLFVGLMLAGFIAFALERREQWRLMAWLIPQRFGYRQIMYYVVIKAVIQALRGPRVGWSSITRSGKADVTLQKRVRSARRRRSKSAAGR